MQDTQEGGSKIDLVIFRDYPPSPFASWWGYVCELGRKGLLVAGRLCVAKAAAGQPGFSLSFSASPSLPSVFAASSHCESVRLQQKGNCTLYCGGGGATLQAGREEKKISL